MVWPTTSEIRFILSFGRAGEEGRAQTGKDDTVGLSGSVSGMDGLGPPSGHGGGECLGGVLSCTLHNGQGQHNYYLLSPICKRDSMSTTATRDGWWSVV